MLNGLQGIPGSGKSYEACVFQVLEALKDGRMVITNLPLNVSAYAAIDPLYRKLIQIRTRPAPVLGTWDAEAIDPDTGKGEAFKLFEDGRHEKPAPGSKTFGTAWCYYSTWKHPKTGQGPLFIVDECHVPMPRVGTPKEVVEYYKLHRHFNCDILLATQNFRQMCQDIAELMAMMVKLRKADVIGKPNQYIRKVHAGYRGAEIQQSIRTYEPHFFALYKSHTQGNSVAEAGAKDVSPFIVKFKRATWLFWLFAIPFAAYAFWPQDKPKPKPKLSNQSDLSAETQERIKRAVEASKGLPPIDPRQEQMKPPEPSPEPKAEVSEVPEPYASKSIHVTGRLEMGKRVLYTFAISDGSRRIADATSDDFKRAGYTWEPLTDCAGTLRWKGKGKALTCDAPVVPQGSKSDPVVLALPTKAVGPNAM